MKIVIVLGGFIIPRTNNLIGVNFGKFLPLRIIQRIYQIYDELQTLTDDKILSDVSAEDISILNQQFNDIEVTFLNGGKDTIFLVLMKVEDYKFIYKLYNLKPYEIFTYLLSINEFNTKIPDKILLEEQGHSAYVHIVPLHVYAVGKITSQTKSSYVVIQEYSETLDYTDFVKDHDIPFNIVKRAWKYIYQNGFVIDFLPSNFKISFDEEQKLYWLEYIDYIFYNDPNFRSYASVIEEQLNNELVDHEYFRLLQRQ